jgi:hypothetical protein
MRERCTFVGMLDGSQLDRQPFASRARNQRSKITNRPSKMVIDGRTPLGRRLRDIADLLAADLGGWAELTEMQAAAVRDAAEYRALAEDARSRRLKGDGSVALDDVVRLGRLAEQCERRLGIGRKREPASTPDLATYLRGLKSEPAPVGPSPTAAVSPKQEREPRVGDVVQLGDHLVEIIDDE